MEGVWRVHEGAWLCVTRTASCPPQMEDEDIIPEEPTLNESMWDATILIGTKTIGSWASVVLTILLLVNIGMVRALSVGWTMPQLSHAPRWHRG